MECFDGHHTVWKAIKSQQLECFSARFKSEKQQLILNQWGNRMGLPHQRDPVIQPLGTGTPAEWFTKWWALFLRNDSLFLTAPTRHTLFARHCAKHEAEMNAPTLGSSVQCISLITALWAVCINKHNTMSLQNGLAEAMDWMLNHTVTLCPWPGATHAQWIYFHNHLTQIHYEAPWALHVSILS